MTVSTSASSIVMGKDTGELSLRRHLELIVLNLDSTLDDLVAASDVQLCKLWIISVDAGLVVKPADHSMISMP